MKSIIQILVNTILALLFFTACSNDSVTMSVTTESVFTMTPEGENPPSSTLTPTSTQMALTDTPSVQYAVIINGEGILLQDYEAEISRFRYASDTGMVSYGEEQVLEDLIDQVLLAQGAKENRFVVDDLMVDERVREMGISEEDLDDWIITNGYSDESFNRAMVLAISSAWMRDKIISEVPSTAEQVHAKQILLHSSSEADVVHARLLAGADFDTLAEEYDPGTGGDLGWFPRGYLIVPELDEPAFSLEPGSISDVIETPLGYHIILVIERDLHHPLNANTRRAVQLQLLAEWLEKQRSLSDIEVLVP